MIKESELILNTDGSVYHLQLKPGEVAKTIITVGDPDRVDNIVRHLDSISVSKQNREFKTVTGLLGNKRLTVIATGIGTDNIDIVFNEIDALFNIDFKTRMVKEKLISLDFVRIGTSGSINPSIPINSIVVSQSTIGLDGLLNFYNAENIRNLELETAFKDHTGIPNSYAVPSSSTLLSKFKSIGTQGITITADGFYGPQSRNIRLDYKYNLVEITKGFSFEGIEVTNLEMETAGIYGLAKLLGHNAISLNAILASRCNGEFSNNPAEVIDNLIEKTLKLI